MANRAQKSLVEADFADPHFGCLMSSLTRLTSAIYVIVGVYDLGAVVLALLRSS